MVFYKMQGENMVFQLANLESKESFAIWDKVNNIVLRQVEGVANIDDLKFMKADLFAQRYPNLGKMSQVVREIIIPTGNVKTQYPFGFKKTANDMLNLNIQTCRNLNINPLEVEFTLRKTGKGFDTTYSVVAGQRVGIPQNVVQSTPKAEIPLNGVEQANKQYNLTQTPIVQPKPQDSFKQGFSVPKPLVETPSPEEMTIIKWANEYQGNLTEADYIAGFQHSLKQEFNRSITDERARKWYLQYYQKK